MTTQSSDVELIRAIRNGNPDAFENLYRRHINRVVAWALSVGCPSSDVDDISQTVFLQVYLNLHRFEGRSAFTTWLHRITFNAVRMSDRVEVRLDRFKTGPSEAIEAVESHLLPPDEYVVRKDLVQKAARIIRKMTPVIRGAMLHRIVYEESIIETASKLRVSPGAMKIRYYRARAQFREELAQQKIL